MNAHLFAFCFCKKTVFLRHFVDALFAHKATEHLVVGMVHIYRLAFNAFRVQTGIQEHGFENGQILRSAQTQLLTRLHVLLGSLPLPFSLLPSLVFIYLLSLLHQETAL